MHALLRPGIGVPGLDAGAIEQARDLPIGHQARQLTYQRNRVGSSATSLHWRASQMAA